MSYNLMAHFLGTFKYSSLSVVGSLCRMNFEFRGSKQAMTPKEQKERREGFRIYLAEQEVLTRPHIKVLPIPKTARIYLICVVDRSTKSSLLTSADPRSEGLARDVSPFENLCFEEMRLDPLQQQHED
ncbi:hypothetical protein CISG_01683 [Coccidioides immitis RMSCC 3703]|uniref:Uncharacterized protein n=1 Tax=Coccidioides immitis RMSCC 3703 TaxID=454286 RepID=A0A0J8R4L5_COCIT|nr:hypothetical protein CISG_01683 [Coccidioides immitis RMSCC 3703]